MSSETLSAPNGRAARIRRVSRAMAAATIAVAVLLIAAYVAVFLDPEALRDTLAREFLPSGAAFTLSPARIAVGFVVGLLPVAVSLYGLWHANRLFVGFGEGAIFTEGAGRRLVRVGAALTLAPVAQILTSALGSLVATFGNAPGERLVMISLADEHVILAVAGLLVVVVGWVMAEAARIAAENEGFV